jgi:hypothetical protein
MDFDINCQYIDTLITAKADIDTTVKSTSDGQQFTTDFSLEGKVVNELVPEMKYKISEDQVDANNGVRYLYFEQGDERYQMGFKMDIVEGEKAKINGADSYGLLSNFVMNEDLDDIEQLTLKNKADKTLGIFDSNSDAYNINFSDGSSDYLFFNDDF